MKMNTRRRFSMRFAFVAAIVIALVAGALTSAGLSTPLKRAAGKAPAPATASLNQRYTACIRSNGATWTLIANSGGMYRVDIPAAASAQCAGLDLAREAAGQGDSATASWLVAIRAPEAFWACISSAGYHITGRPGQRSDYGSAAFAAIARDCAVSSGVTLPAR